jgi:hypothetical protein
MQTKYKVVFLLALLLPLVSTPVGMNLDNINIQQIDTNQVSQIPDAYYIHDVPYVWQEVNGYCASAAISMVLQSMNMDLDLHDLFSVMGTGFSAIYIGIDQTRTLYPGVLIRQPEYLQFFFDLYGLEFTTYLDTRESFGREGANNYDRLSVEYIDYANSTTPSPFDIVRNTISSDIPLAVAVDLYYLPPEDYADYRQYGAPLDAYGVAHAITIVGYNDTSQEIYIQDPGVGLFGDDAGYPDDGRWNYTMSYFDFNQAWQSAGYVTFKFTQGTGPIDNFEERLGEHLIERLRGDRSGYFEEFDAFYLSPGKSAFSALGLDLTVDSIADYARYFLEVNKDEALLSLGHITEMFLTIQYHGYLHGLDTIQDVLPGVDLTAFFDAADDALPHFEVLTCNESIQTLVGMKSRDTLLFNTFEGIANDFQSSGNLEESIGNHQGGLDEIRGHLFAIADSWNAAADALEAALDLPVDTEPLDASIPIVLAGAAIIILAVVIYLVRRGK